MQRSRHGRIPTEQSKKPCIRRSLEGQVHGGEEAMLQWAADKKAGLVDGKFPMPKLKLGKLPGQKPKPGVAVDDAGLLLSSMEGGMNGGESDNGADDYF